MRKAGVHSLPRLTAGALASLLAAVIFGLLTMHSLAIPNGAPHHGSGAEPAVTSGLHADERPMGVEKTDAQHSDSLPGGHLTMLCGAMLVAATAAAIAWLIVQRAPLRCLFNFPRAPALQASAEVLPAAAGPPRYLTLSVCRC